MTKEEIEIIIREKLSEYLTVNSDELKDDTRFSDMGADSLDIVDIALMFEKTFEIEISDFELEKMLTVKEMIDAIYAIVETKNLIKPL